jgi:hypothetical protein
MQQVIGFFRRNECMCRFHFNGGVFAAVNATRTVLAAFARGKAGWKKEISQSGDVSTPGALCIHDTFQFHEYPNSHLYYMVMCSDVS